MGNGKSLDNLFEERAEAIKKAGVTESVGSPLASLAQERALRNLQGMYNDSNKFRFYLDKLFCGRVNGPFIELMELKIAGNVGQPSYWRMYLKKLNTTTLVFLFGHVGDSVSNSGEFNFGEAPDIVNFRFRQFFEVLSDPERALDFFLSEFGPP